MPDSYPATSLGWGDSGRKQRKHFGITELSTPQPETWEWESLLVGADGDNFFSKQWRSGWIWPGGNVATSLPSHKEWQTLIMC